MIERVAEALFRRDQGWRGHWLEVSERLRDEHRDQARVAIAALREPTDAVMNAIIASFGSDDDRSSAECALDAWLAGIDRALAEEAK